MGGPAAHALAPLRARSANQTARVVNASAKSSGGAALVLIVAQWPQQPRLRGSRSSVPLPMPLPPLRPSSLSETSALQPHGGGAEAAAAEASAATSAASSPPSSPDPPAAAAAACSEAGGTTQSHVAKASRVSSAAKA